MSSFFGSKGKQYGLIISNKKAGSKSVAKKPSVFGDSSSDEEADGKRHVNVSLKREHEKRAKQTHEAAVQALSEDPSIFEYDSLYDKMAEEKKKANPKLAKDAKPKYFHALKKAAERRKLEGDLVYEHQAQRELEKEEQDFADKESFVTSGYKKKLQERKVLEEELAKEAAQEEANDVTKQKDLSRFHKYLFSQVVSPESGSKPAKGEQVKTEAKSEQRQSSSSHSSSSREKESGSHRESKERGEDTRARRQSSEREGRGRDGERRRQSSDGEGRGRDGERRRQSSEREGRGRDGERRRRSSEGEGRGRDGERRRSSQGEGERRREGEDRERHAKDDEHYRKRRSSNEKRERRDSYRKRERTPESSPRKRNESISDDRTQPSPAEETQGEEQTSKQSSPPPQKKMKLQAGIEVEVDEMEPAERRKLAAAKRSTQETTMSAKERFLARKRVRLVSEGTKPPTTDE